MEFLWNFSYIKIGKRSKYGKFLYGKFLVEIYSVLLYNLVDE